MNASILDGKAAAEAMQSSLKQTIAEARLDRSPHLVVMIVGEDPASRVYVATKQKRCEAVGMRSTRIALSDTISQDDLLHHIAQLNADEDVHGILVQLPLPEHIDTQRIIEAIDVHKDVDGFHPFNLGRLAQKVPRLRPCTPFGIMQLLEHYQIPVLGKHAVVVGCSRIVGLPMSLELLAAKATVSICHRDTAGLAAMTQQADILVTATGQPRMITDAFVKDGAVVIDVGIIRLESGEIVGDVDFDSVSHKASWLTPVPGGVGPMTVTALLQNTWTAFQSTR